MSDWSTPGAINGPTLGTALTAQPAFDHADGFYTAPFQLALTDATPGAQIYYRTRTHGAGIDE